MLKKVTSVPKLAKNACKLLTAHGSLCCYTVGIYGRRARIFRFDHASAIASPLFDYVKYLHTLLDLLHRLNHPDFDRPGAVLGHDDSSYRINNAAELENIGMPGLDARDRICDRLVMPSGCGKYYLLRSCSINPRLSFRTTMVREAVEVFRLRQDGDDTTLRWKTDSRKAAQAVTDDYVPVRVIVGEAWRMMNFLRERNIEGFGLPKMLHGEDLGDLRDADGNFTSHFTRRMRVVLDSVGAPLSEFESTKELVQAMRDAIEGHSRVGVPHRDVRDGNVMIIRDPRKKHTGLVDGFELPNGNRGSPLSDDDFNVVDELKRELKKREGTPQFISVSLLQVRSVDSNGEPVESEPIEHAVCHDLESFYWLLIWIVIRHTDHSSVHGALACSRLFDAGTKGDAFELTTGHLGKMPLSVKGSEPLSWLMRGLKSLVAAAYLDELAGPVVLGGDGERRVIPLTYESVLQVFDRALVMDGGPENDKAIPFPPPTLRQKLNKPSDGTLNFGSGGKQKDSVRADGQGGLPTIVQASTHDGVYYGTNKGPDLPRLRSIAGPSGTAAGPSASGAASTKRRKRNWSEILPAREQHEHKAKRARQN
ncbi:hypothetical protein WOLCODRAFT_167703 [Wolfiporia cocos MD-104 SS10]|uniref:Fungal-type protein kinase domain-containing protein n=1 Tax=Wolfiporia cocos (strain MD-104) TaxID=742152 RepID=A0A2H3JMG9_WOLCO|nr:hypothetical protein WOLCODRAFT_167703 [Wolfiporia cocos MD-104 SS10]